MDKQTGVSVRFDLETRLKLKGLLFVMLNELLSWSDKSEELRVWKVSLLDPYELLGAFHLRKDEWKFWVMLKSHVFIIKQLIYAIQRNHLINLNIDLN